MFEIVRKLIKANDPAKIRMAAIEMLQKGFTQTEVAEKFGVHCSTIGEWYKMYQEGGVERLKADMKPRPKYELIYDEILQVFLACTDLKRKKRLARLMRLANGVALKQVAADDGVSVQSIMKDRKLYLDGKLN